MEPISEDMARRLLGMISRPGTNIHAYRAARVKGGWALMLDSQAGWMPFASFTWIVTDSRQVIRLGMGESVDEALARIGN